MEGLCKSVHDHVLSNYCIKFVRIEKNYTTKFGLRTDRIWKKNQSQIERGLATYLSFPQVNYSDGNRDSPSWVTRVEV